MKTAPKLQEVVTQIAAKHDVDLARPGAYLRLELAGHGQLVIENIGGGRVSVTNYIEVSRTLVADPQVVFYLVLYPMRRPEHGAPGQTFLAWIPLEITDLFDGWRLYAELDVQDGLTLYDPTGQAELARFSDDVLARHLRSHGWLEQGQRSTAPFRTWSEDEILARDIRIDEMFGADEETEA